MRAPFGCSGQQKAPLNEGGGTAGDGGASFREAHANSEFVVNRAPRHSARSRRIHLHKSQFQTVFLYEYSHERLSSDAV